MTIKQQVAAVIRGGRWGRGLTCSPQNSHLLAIATVPCKIASISVNFTLQNIIHSRRDAQALRTHISCLLLPLVHSGLTLRHSTLSCLHSPSPFCWKALLYQVMLSMACIIPIIYLKFLIMVPSLPKCCNYLVFGDVYFINDGKMRSHSFWISYYPCHPLWRKSNLMKETEETKQWCPENFSWIYCSRWLYHTFQNLLSWVISV